MSEQCYLVNFQNFPRLSSKFFRCLWVLGLSAVKWHNRIDILRMDKFCIILDTCAGVFSCFSCVRLCNPMDCSLPGSYVHGILQEIILEWVAMPFSRGSSQARDQTPTLQADSFLLSHWGRPHLCYITQHNQGHFHMPSSLPRSTGWQQVTEPIHSPGQRVLQGMGHWESSY